MAVRRLLWTCVAALAVAVLSLTLIAHRDEGATLSVTQAGGADQMVASEVPGIGADVVLDGKTYYEEAMLRERIIQKCMSDAGFEYKLAPPVIATSDTPPDAATDPNQEIVAGFDKAQWEAYSMALAGLPDANSPDKPMEEWANGGGCLGLAHSTVPGLYRVDPALVEGALEVRRKLNTPEGPSCIEAGAGVASPRELDELVASGKMSVEEVDALEACLSNEQTEQQATYVEALQVYVASHEAEFQQFLEKLESGRAAAETYLGQ